MKAYNIDLIGDVGDKMVRHLVVELQKAKPSQKIQINLFTHGGDVYAGMAIYDLLKRIEEDITIITHGACMSMGTVILMAGSKRIAMPNCSFLVHYGTEWNESGADKKQNEDVNKRIKDIMVEKTGGSKRKVGKWLDGETYFDVAKALKEGLIDEVHSE